MIIAGIIQTFAGNAIVAHAFGGIRVAVCVLILAAVLKLAKGSIKDKLTVFIFIVTALAMILLDLSPIVVVVISGLVGYLAKLSKIKKEGAAK